MSNVVFPESMDRISGRSTEDALSIMDNYIRYMVERINQSLVNLSRKSGITTEDLVDRINQDEININTLEGDILRINGILPTKVSKNDVEDFLSTTSINPVQNKTLTTEINKKFNTSDIDNELNNTSENPVQNKVIFNELEAKVRGKPFVITYTGSCLANSNYTIGTQESVFDIDDPVLAISLKSITDSNIFDPEGSLYIDNGNVMYHAKTAITNPVITGIVFY